LVQQGNDDRQRSIGRPDHLIHLFRLLLLQNGPPSPGRRSWPPLTTAAIRLDAAAALFQTFEERFGTNFCVCASFPGSVEGAPKKGITDISEFHCFVHRPNCHELQRFRILESYVWHFLILNRSLRSSKMVAISAMPPLIRQFGCAGLGCLSRPGRRRMRQMCGQGGNSSQRFSCGFYLQDGFGVPVEQRKSVDQRDAAGQCRDGKCLDSRPASQRTSSGRQNGQSRRRQGERRIVNFVAAALSCEIIPDVE
jgi:hypothetical protein